MKKLILFLLLFCFSVNAFGFTEIVPTDCPIYWTTSILSGSLQIVGMTDPGLVTAGPAEFKCSEREDGFLQIAESIVDKLPALPSSGWLQKGSIYNYNDVAVMVLQAHERTIFPPESTPALFSIYRDEIDGLEWAANESVSVGWTRTYKGKSYTCLQAHTTQSDWTPDIAPALWSEIVEPGDGWAAGVAYIVGQSVTYKDIVYECLQAHTSMAGWEPPNVPALWAVVK